MPVKPSKLTRMFHFSRLTGKPSRLNGMRASKNSHPNDFFPGPGKHTRPVTHHNADDTGVRDPSRRRHRQTRILREQRKAEQAAQS